MVFIRYGKHVTLPASVEVQNEMVFLDTFCVARAIVSINTSVQSIYVVNCMFYADCAEKQRLHERYLVSAE